MKRVSIKDIAREAKVSPATVSRVINNSPLVNEATRKRVQEIINKKHYKPNEIARGLYTKRTKTLGVILPDITNHFFAKVFQEIEKATLQYGQSVLLCNTLNDYTLEKFYVERLSEKQVDGLILLGGHVNKTITDASFVELLKRDYFETPVVIINGKLDGYENCISVSSDEYGAVFTALDYLLKLGHREIGFIGGCRGITSTDQKLDAFENAKKLYKFQMKNNWIYLSGYTFNHGMSSMQELLKEKELPTAVFAINDEVAAGAISTCYKNKIKVPDDISIFGFDNSFISITTNPNITTMSHPYRTLGESAVKLINKMINKEIKAGEKRYYSMTLIERDSCKAKS